MPLTYEIHEDAGVIALTASGKLTSDDIAQYLADSRAHPAFRPTMHRLVMVGHIDSFPDLPQVRQIPLRPIDGKDHHVRIAAVAETDLGRGMVSMLLGHWGLAG